MTEAKGRTATRSQEDAMIGCRHDEPRFELLPTTFETRGSDPGWFFWLLAASLLGVSVWVTVLFVHWLAS